MTNIQPKGAKVLVKVIDKENKESKTDSGLFIPKKDADSHDNALLMGEVVKLGTPELDKDTLRSPDVELGVSVFFNRYNAFITITEGIDTYYVVDCKDIWATEEKQAVVG